MAKKKRTLQNVWILDLETTPFRYGVEPQPFLCVLWHKTEGSYTFWGDDCIKKSSEFISKNLDNQIIYAHNGGNFDFIYYLRGGFVDNPLTIIHRRIVQCKIGNNFFRDSLAIIPVALNNYQKTKIDYKKFERTRREKYRKEITQYCIDDCRYVYDLVEKFIEMNGFKLTVGSASKNNIQNFYNRKFKTNKIYDDKIRPFYFGGRVEAYKTGKIEGNFKYYDVNSLYPSAMCSKHFSSDGFIRKTQGNWSINSIGNIVTSHKEYKDNVYLAHISVSKNLSALCKYNDDDRLSFNEQNTDFYTTSHEIRIALKHNLITITKFHTAYISYMPVSFKEYIEELHKYKQASKKDPVLYLMYKFLLNACYGKFGQNSNKYKKYIMTDNDCGKESYEEIFKKGYKPASRGDEFTMFEKPDPSNQFVDVGISASITGKARAIMLNIIAHCINPIYTDTDSITCEGITDDGLLGNNLGDLELEHDNLATLYVAGKKLYEFHDDKGNIIAHASKGFKYEDNDIKNLIDNGFLEKKNIAPCFKLGRKTTFVTRTLKFNK